MVICRLCLCQNIYQKGNYFLLGNCYKLIFLLPLQFAEFLALQFWPQWQRKEAYLLSKAEQLCCLERKAE